MLLFPNASSLYTQHISQVNGRGLSPALWRHLTTGTSAPDGSGGGTWFGDDFTSFTPVTVTTAAAQLQPGNGYYAYIEVDATVGSILPLATETGGVVRFLTSTDSSDGADHQTSLTTGGYVGTLGAISDTAGSEKLTIFESRIRLTSVTDAAGSVFVGMGEEGLAAVATPHTQGAGQPLSSDDLIGWSINEADNDSLTFKYRLNGQTLTTAFTYGTALAAATWYKLGFIYNPRAEASKRISLYIDNVEQGTYITATNIATSSGSAFPDGEELAMIAAIIGSANNAPQSFDMDWWAFYQEA